MITPQEIQMKVSVDSERGKIDMYDFKAEAEKVV